MAVLAESAGFTSILREPDLVIGAVEGSAFRFEEKINHNPSPVKWSYIPTEEGWNVVVYPSGKPVKYLKLRWHGDLSAVESVFGDEWGRVSATHTPVEWRSVMPWRPLPWFCFARAGDSMTCYGVKTGCNCFAFFQVDPHGVTLFLNLMSGAQGTSLIEPFTACTVTETVRQTSETVFQTARRFMSMLCLKPVLPKEPVFGVNNWYWAYGNISRDTIRQETDYLLEMTDGTEHRPCMVIDDGWQINRTTKPHLYIGGPFSHGNERFGDMQTVAEGIRGKGVKPGIWYRPLLTLGDLPEEAKLRSHANGIVMDPSHPYTLERLREDAARIRSWGYEIIKHDFSSNDALCSDAFQVATHMTCLVEDGKAFYDTTKTTAMILKNIYTAIQDGAGDADVIGCSTIGHLAAGIHSIQRVGTDTSGRSIEWTIRNGVHAFMRLPMNDAFFRMDPDCAAFTDKVDKDINLQFLELCALTNTTAIASVTPGFFSERDLARINKIYRMADSVKKSYDISHFERCAVPEVFSDKEGKEQVFDWMQAYDGSRVSLTWTE